MKRYIDIIYKFQKPFMVLFILLNITAIVGIFKLKIATDFDIFKIKGSIPFGTYPTDHYKEHA